VCGAGGRVRRGGSSAATAVLVIAGGTGAGRSVPSP
jgi:hypothetical protein